MKLTDIQKKLAEQLLLTVIHRESIVEYNELANRINPPIYQRQVGKEIGEISKLCYELGLPLLSAKVVSRGSGKAGVGFYNLMTQLGIDTKGKSEKELFAQELKKIRECKEWHKLADYLNLDLELPRIDQTQNSNIDMQTKVDELKTAPQGTQSIHEQLEANIESDFEKELSLEKEVMELAPLPEELVATQAKTFIEGAKKQIFINAYERNPVARRKCIHIHGSKCVICSFDFGAFYGSNFEGKIHVHHIKPLHLIDDTYEVNPEQDLKPVCPNCHMVLHSKQNGIFSIEEVQQMIARSKRN